MSASVESFEVEIVFHLRHDPRRSLDALISAAPLSQENLAAAWKADADDIPVVTDFILKMGWRLVSVDEAGAMITALASPPSSDQAQSFTDPTPPPEVCRRLRAVLGLEYLTPPAAPATPSIEVEPCTEAGLDESQFGDNDYLMPAELANRYAFPDMEQSLGEGQSVGLIILGGGCYRSDLDVCFQGMGIDVPELTVSYGPNQGVSDDIIGRPASKELLEPFLSGLLGWGDPDFGICAWTHQASKNIQIVGALAPKAHQFLYFGELGAGDMINPNELMRILTQILLSPASERPSVLCLCLDIDERVPGLGLRLPGTAFSVEELIYECFAVLAAQGITICVSSGDMGAGAVAFPSTSPHVLACGGCTLGEKGQTETVWNEWYESPKIKGWFAGAGGISPLVPVPDWQSEVRMTYEGKSHAPKMRAVPDVAAVANYQRGVQVIVSGRRVWGFGTGVSALIWASLFVLINKILADENMKPVGFITQRLYEDRYLQEACVGIIHGHNAIPQPGGDPVEAKLPFQAKLGWNPCTGWGRPDGKAWVQVLSAGGKA